MPRPFGRSLHIGVNEVDADHYADYRGKLQGCENDAWFMAGLARHYCFSDIRVLLGRQATADVVLDEIRSAAADLPEGGFFLLTFSGHGGQLVNNDQSESETYDQTWCLYDRELIDDELRWKCWPLFRTNARVLVIADSCHSGTSIEIPAGLSPSFADSVSSCVPDDPNVVFRELPEGVALATAILNRSLYADIQRSLAGRTPPKLPGNVLLIAACLDEEKTPDGNFGKFTDALRSVWDEGRFSGTHGEFFEALYQKVVNSYGRHPRTCCQDTGQSVLLNAPAFKI